MCQRSRGILDEFQWQGHRLIVAHRSDSAMEMGRRRDERIAELETAVARLAGKLDRQDCGGRYKGRRFSDSVAKARF